FYYIYYIFMFFFFFSSRRRHTRSKRDWSSDVCSSDLTIHKHDALAMLSIGTSQEGSDAATIRQIALQNKMVGADIHHIGDAGYTGIAIPENIMDYSIAIRGKRHTIVRMAGSVNR